MSFYTSLGMGKNHFSYKPVFYEKIFVKWGSVCSSGPRRPQLLDLWEGDRSVRELTENKLSEAVSKNLRRRIRTLELGDVYHLGPDRMLQRTREPEPGV